MTALSLSARGVAAALGVVVAAGLTGATATAAPSAAQPSTQPYHHLVRPGPGFHTGGTYVTNTRGPITLDVNRSAGAVDVFVEECGSHDLGRVVRIPAGNPPPQELASDVSAGTCFVLLSRAAEPEQSFQLAGTLTY